METNFITRVNNVDIVATNNAEKLVPIKPICEALGIDAKVQRNKIQDDSDLCSVGVLSTSTGADGKQYEMFCLPIEFIFGWLFTINPKNVKEEAQQVVRQYRMECYRALYEYFTEPQTFLKQKQVLMEEKVNEYQSRQREFKDAQKMMNEAKAELNQVMKFTIEDWRANNRQLSLSFAPEE